MTSTIVRPPRRLSSWPARRWVPLIVGVYVYLTAAAITEFHDGSRWLLVPVAIATVVIVDAALGLPLTLALAGSRRYVRWTLRCRRGRRCANLVVMPARSASDSNLAALVVTLNWTCGSCGTAYESRQEVPPILTAGGTTNRQAEPA